jgi:hypothetical protein
MIGVEFEVTKGSYEYSNIRIRDNRLAFDRRFRKYVTAAFTGCILPVEKYGPTGGQRATSGRRPLVNRPSIFLLDLLLVTTSYEKFSKILILLTSAALSTSGTHDNGFKTVT